MIEAAGWIAPVATTLAAMMTAGNLGSRVTGWGFVVFTVGSIAWVMIAVASGQGNLLWTNGFLTLVNVVGIWRWLGRQARFEDGAHAAEASSRAGPAANLFSLGAVQSGPIYDSTGAVIGHAVDAMAECATGRVGYVMVSEGGAAGIGERLHAVPWQRLTPHEGGFAFDGGATELAALPVADPVAWPAGPA